MSFDSFRFRRFVAVVLKMVLRPASPWELGRNANSWALLHT